MNGVLCLSPHPDDESIGCGGTLRRHVEAGDRVEVVFLTSGEAGGHGRDPADTARAREREAGEAAGILGVAGTEFWRGPDGGLRATAALVERTASRIREAGAARLYAPHIGEMHADHRAAARLARQAVRRLPADARPELLFYEVWTPLARMDEVVDISPYIEKKRAAIRAYRTQCDVLRFDEAALGLSRYRGEMHSWPGGPYAEVFVREPEPPTPTPEAR